MTEGRVSPEDRSAGRWCEVCQQHGSHHTDRHHLYVEGRVLPCNRKAFSVKHGGWFRCKRREGHHAGHLPFDPDAVTTPAREQL